MTDSAVSKESIEAQLENPIRVAASNLGITQYALRKIIQQTYMMRNWPCRKVFVYFVINTIVATYQNTNVRSPNVRQMARL